ncbi:uncharacterized protein B0I36DRAFT_333027 [Microdochium trichocladiopsis]|uniref:Secreted protein n=1 Tax=Microdochium trichocladiopsis TaxID=1682393 RepID=A0A9P8XYU9_9PEZI|nr:uncharacterized protein B0I36DRAFT_333027 [Microdochium trichocladiopsis]KAH7025307.1 hypothetical protein B0I36DRAFT_333027 [Microdochium trichocladiopsis]
MLLLLLGRRLTIVTVVVVRLAANGSAVTPMASLKGCQQMLKEFQRKDRPRQSTSQNQEGPPSTPTRKSAPARGRRVRGESRPHDPALSSPAEIALCHGTPRSFSGSGYGEDGPTINPDSVGDGSSPPGERKFLPRRIFVLLQLTLSLENTRQRRSNGNAIALLLVTDTPLATVGVRRHTTRHT